MEVYFHEPFENVSVCLMRYGSLRTLRECDCVCLSLVELFTCYSGKRSLRTPCVTSVISPVHSQLFSHLLTSIYWLCTGPTMHLVSCWTPGTPCTCTIISRLFSTPVNVCGHTDHIQDMHVPY